MMLSSIVWDVDPTIFEYPTIGVRKWWLVIGIIVVIIFDRIICAVERRKDVAKKEKQENQVCEAKLQWYHRLITGFILLLIVSVLLSVIWPVGPIVFTTPHELRWYGVVWALGFILSIGYTERLFNKEGYREQWFEELFYYCFFGVIIGARLGHCLFYQWDYYTSNPIEILKIWEGGLASHGGVFGVIFAAWIYSKKITKQSVWWLFDRIIPSVAILCFCIRFGNLMNSEIFGYPTDLPWGFEFVRSREWHQLYEGQACHPTQIYEMLYCLTAGVVSYVMYHKFHLQKYVGLITGVSLLIFFGTRLALEFMKNPQVAEEVGMTLNIGQLLSLPLIALGLYLIYKSRTARELPMKKDK